jgi:thioredoxin reductase
MEQPTEFFDVVIVGAGPAGLSASLLLGRSRRRTLVFDSGEYRNAASRQVRGFLTRDGIPPDELRRIAIKQLASYSQVTLDRTRIVAVERQVNAPAERTEFLVTREDGQSVRCRKVLLATGVRDEIPQIDGIAPMYGISVHHCPYCDGYEVCDLPLAIYGKGTEALRFALELTLWSRDLTLCTDGPAELTDDERNRLQCNDIRLREEPIRCLEGSADGQIQRVVFTTGENLPCHSLFFKTSQCQRSDLAARLGCTFTEKGTVDTGAYESTNIPGVYVAGDASPTVQLAIVAASEGTQAAFAINTALLKEDLV